MNVIKTKKIGQILRLVNTIFTLNLGLPKYVVQAVQQFKKKSLEQQVSVLLSGFVYAY